MREQQCEAEHDRHQHQAVDQYTAGAREELAVLEDGDVVAQPGPHLGAAALAEPQADDLLTAEADVERVQDRDGEEGEEAERRGRDEQVAEAIGATAQGRGGAVHASWYP